MRSQCAPRIRATSVARVWRRLSMMTTGLPGAHPVRPGRKGTAMERDPDRRAYAFAVGGGALLWSAAMAASGQRAAWDSGRYWIGAYPRAILRAPRKRIGSAQGGAGSVNPGGG